VRAIVADHYEFVWRSLRGLGVPAAALDDEAQRVFWLVARKIETIADGTERSFLFRLATGVASNHRRTLRRRREVIDDEALLTHRDGAPSPEELASREQARRLMDAILGSLPVDLRMVFVLFELEELDMPEIASCLEIPTGTVASRLRRAREKFHAALERLQKRRGFGESP
jgi:RNA polymerase sigma-70 factor (ECF subfamily)